MNVDVKRLQAKIEDLETRLEQEKREKAQYEGKLDTLRDQLKKQFGVSSVKDADVELKKMDKEIVTLTEEQDELMKELEKVLATA